MWYINVHLFPFGLNIYAPYGLKSTLQGTVRWFEHTLYCTALSLVCLGVNVLVSALGLVLVGWLPRLQRGRGFKHWLLCRGVEREITHMKGICFYFISSHREDEVNVRVRQNERVCPRGNIQVVFIQILRSFVMVYSLLVANGECLDTTQ